MPAEERQHRAVLVGITPRAESDAIVRLFADGRGALVARARGLRKAQGKLAPLLQPADELKVRIATGRGGAGLLIGVEIVRAHPHWRADLGLLALYWFMAECLYVGAGEDQVNADMYRLLANLLRSEPAGDLRYGAAAAFSSTVSSGPAAATIASVGCCRGPPFGSRRISFHSLASRSYVHISNGRIVYIMAQYDVDEL